MRKYLFNNSWFKILGVYVVTFIVSFVCAAVASEEYTKGQSRLIDAGNNICNYVFFSPASLFEPVITNVHSGMILLVFLVNTVINAMFWVTGINFLYMKFVGRRGRKQ